MITGILLGILITLIVGFLILRKVGKGSSDILNEFWKHF